MTPEQIAQNESFFKSVLNSVKEGGIFIYPDAGAVFKKVAGKLTGTQDELTKVKDLVTPEFLKNHFVANN